MSVPSSELGLPRPLSRNRVCLPPGTNGDNTRLWVKGAGGANSGYWRESLALCVLLLWGLNSLLYSTRSIIFPRRLFPVTVLHFMKLILRMQRRHAPDTSLPMHLGWGGASTWSSLASRPDVPYITTYLHTEQG